MMWLKACPRCAGDLLLQSDFYGSNVACLQCGYILRSDEDQRLKGALATVKIRADGAPSQGGDRI